MGLQPRTETADALWFGIGVHIALAGWYQKGYKRGQHPAKTFDAWVGDEMREIRANYTDHDREWFEEPKYLDARDLGIGMLEAYVDTYGKDPDWYIIAIEEPFRLRLDRAGKPIATVMSTWDGVYRDRADGRVKLLENKTAQQIATSYLSIDGQGGLYHAVATQVLRAREVLEADESIAEITYNFLRKAKPDDRPVNEGGARLNKDGRVSKRQPPPMFVREPIEKVAGQDKRALERVADEVAVMNAMRRGEIPVYKSTTRDCTWCMFFDMCEMHELGGDDWKEFMRSSFSQQNPYDRYVKSAGGWT